MSLYYETRVTLTVDGDERDVGVRAFVAVSPDLGMGGSWGAEIDGDVDAFINGDWWPIDSLSLDVGDAARAEDALLDEALADDSAWSGAA